MIGYILAIIFLFLFIGIFSLLKKEKKNYEELKQLQDEQLRNRFKEEFQKEVIEKEKIIQAEDKKIQEKKQKNYELELHKNQIQREINEKENFNNSLFKVREEELDRLIEEKRVEKEEALTSQLQKEELEARQLYRNQYVVWLNVQEAEKQKFLEEFEELKKQQNDQLIIYQKEIENIKEELNEYKSKRSAINEQLRREEELANQLDFHRIILNQLDKDDIHYLISIEQNIHNKEILYKLIWSEYIQKPFNQMIKNVCGNNIPRNVIYCIENISNQKKYIGKTSAEVSKRWTEHVKNSLNIGGIKRQLVHDAMFGHWDEFTFSILEEVKDEKLGEREKYYISFFETDKYGYNLKSGG